MSLADEYKRQFAWRSWQSIFDALPPVRGCTILDLGCGVGDQAAEMVARGARVIGIELNEGLLQEAQSRQLQDAEFRRGDLRTLSSLGCAADGLWCSYMAAYFPDLPVALESWVRHLQPGGWVALTEVDDLFGHAPLSTRTKELLDGFAGQALSTGHDFHMGRKLRNHMEQSGLTISKTMVLPDQELSFDGPARGEVLAAWRARFDRMTRLQDFCGPEFEQVREEFLDCLMQADHRSVAQVICCIAIKQAQ